MVMRAFSSSCVYSDRGSRFCGISPLPTSFAASRIESWERLERYSGIAPGRWRSSTARHLDRPRVSDKLSRREIYSKKSIIPLGLWKRSSWESLL